MKYILPIIISLSLLRCEPNVEAIPNIPEYAKVKVLNITTLHDHDWAIIMCVDGYKYIVYRIMGDNGVTMVQARDRDGKFQRCE